jgi:hypothetical protein
MPTNQQVAFPPPLDWQELQRMTCDLFRKLWRNPHAQEYGTLGSKQHGVDVCGVVAKGKKKLAEGVQCKVTSRLTADQVEAEYEKSQSFRPALSRFVLVTTAKRNTDAQQKAVELSLDGKYPCDLMFWEDFCAKLGRYPKLIRRHYSQFIVVQMVGDASSRLVRFGMDTDNFEMVLTVMPDKDKHYGGTILVSDLLTRRCETYHLGGHYSRLEDMTGYRWRAFVVSKWLNRFENTDELMRVGKQVYSFGLSEEERAEGRDEGLSI